MRTCDYCSHLILTGGMREKYGVFCSEYCATEAVFLKCYVLDKDVLNLAWRIREKNCPACKRSGPIDIQPGNYAKSQFVRSVLKSRDGMYDENLPELRCGSCDILSSFKNSLKVLYDSKFGFASVLLSPRQLAKNLFYPRFSVANEPSALLLEFAKCICLWEAFWDVHCEKFSHAGMTVSEYCESKWLREDFFHAALQRVGKTGQVKQT